MCRLLTLVLCGTLALCADVCRNLPDGPPHLSNSLDTPKSVSFRLSVAAGGPAFRITVRSRPFEMSDKVIHAGDIEVAHCDNGKRLQLLPIMTAQPNNFGAMFETCDINFDGYKDFFVVVEHGAKWGRRLWWVYDPSAAEFVQNELTVELGKLATNDVHIDPKKHEIITEDLMAGCPSLATRYRVEHNRLIAIHRESGDQNIANGCTVTVSDLVAGSLRVTHVRRYANGRRVK